MCLSGTNSAVVALQMLTAKRQVLLLLMKRAGEATHFGASTQKAVTDNLRLKLTHKKNTYINTH